MVRGDDSALYSEAMPQKEGQNDRDKVAHLNRGLAALFYKGP